MTQNEIWKGYLLIVCPQDHEIRITRKALYLFGSDPLSSPELKQFCRDAWHLFKTEDLNWATTPVHGVEVTTTINEAKNRLCICTEEETVAMVHELGLVDDRAREARP
jgi:hypothetical protein